MPRTRSSTIAGVALATVGVIILTACVGSAAGATTADPSAPVASAPIGSLPATTPEPTAQATEAPAETPEPTPASTQPADDGDPTSVELETFDGHAVTVSILDETGSVSGAVTGHPGDGVSVEGYTLHVAQVDADTLRLTWIDYPIDNELKLLVMQDAGGQLRLVMVQPEPKGDTDAIGFDRELLLSFDRPVEASQVQAFLQDGLDTPG